MRRSTPFLILLALLVGFALFKVKYEVVEIEQKLQHTLVQIGREEENIHILKAEWSHLNEPQRLQNLAKKYLDIGSIKTEQVVVLTTEGRPKEKIQTPSLRTHLASMKESK